MIPLPQPCCGWPPQEDRAGRIQGAPALSLVLCVPQIADARGQQRLPMAALPPTTTSPLLRQRYSHLSRFFCA